MTNYEDPVVVLRQFINCCKSAKSKIDIWYEVFSTDSKDGYGYKLMKSHRMLDFLANDISVLAWCKPEQLGYERNPNAPFVYGYKFLIKGKDGDLGYFAFIKLIPNKNYKSKFKWQLKSIHKDTEMNLDIIAGFIKNGEKIIREKLGLIK